MDPLGNRKAVCLLSGGLDSTTVLYFAIREGYIPLALTIDYGQLHRRELESAARITKQLGIEHQMISVPFPWRGSALLDSG
ncbi:MAG: 7-cyano-7-deazaguanine synthase, partial [Candidatus Omnitrophica bacterium]|nr:7-cyano-7-deazaguanine synthase [Candidatus Omnitrophota bacterium]